MFGEPITLIVVYKDELLLNLLKKLVETKDDIDEDHIIGVSDGSVRIVSWTEKVWLDQKKAGNINNKVLFLGKVKGWDKLIPVIDIKFDEFGIKYGWAGNQAILISEIKAFEDSNIYNSFLDQLNKYQIPESIKSDKVVIEEDVKENVFTKVGGFFKKNIIDPLSPEQKKRLKQQYFYGIQKLYENHLEEFINK